MMDNTPMPVDNDLERFYFNLSSVDAFLGLNANKETSSDLKSGAYNSYKQMSEFIAKDPFAHSETDYSLHGLLKEDNLSSPNSDHSASPGLDTASPTCVPSKVDPMCEIFDSIRGLESRLFSNYKNLGDVFQHGGYESLPFAQESATETDAEFAEPDKKLFPSALHEVIKSDSVSERVPVPSSDHAAEIIGKSGCKIKELRRLTNTYIKSPVRDQEPEFFITGTSDNVALAKEYIVRQAEHFTQLRKHTKMSSLAGLAGQLVTLKVRVAKEYVGLVVGPKGKTIKKIQEKTHTHIVTPNHQKEPVFMVTGLQFDVENARDDINDHIDRRTSLTNDMDIVGAEGELAYSVAAANPHLLNSHKIDRNLLIEELLRKIGRNNERPASESNNRISGDRNIRDSLYSSASKPLGSQESIPSSTYSDNSEFSNTPGEEGQFRAALVPSKDSIFA